MKLTLWRRPAIRWGVPLGAVLGLVGALLTIVTITGHEIGLGGWFGVAQFVIVAGVFLGAGWLVARQTANVTQGSLAGLTTGVIAAFVVGLTDFVLAVAAPGPYARLVAGFDSLSAQHFSLAGTVFAAWLLNVMQYGIFGAALGILGGMAGTMRIGSRRQADQARSR